MWRLSWKPHVALGATLGDIQAYGGYAAAHSTLLSCWRPAAHTPIIVCVNCANAILPVTLQMRCESRPAFLNAYLRLLSSSHGDTIDV